MGEPLDERDHNGPVRYVAPWKWVAGKGRTQWGMVSLEQMLRFGLSQRRIRRRVASGQLVLVHRGVYAVGYVPRALESTWMAATLATGDAPLSHRHAAGHWGMSSRRGAPVHVTPPKPRRSRRGIVAHRAAIEPDEITSLRGIPITIKARTLLDLAAILSPKQLELAFDRAGLAGFDLAELEVLLRRYPNRKGIATLRALAARLDPSFGVVRSSLEARFSRWLTDRALPPGVRNAHLEIEGELIQPDVMWRDRRLIVELDGRHHLTQSQIDADKRKDRRIRVAGWQIVRISGRMLDSEAAEIEADLRRLLGVPTGSARGPG